MKLIPTCAAGNFAVAALLLSPMILMFAIPVAVGIGIDIFELAGGEAPVALVLCSPLAFVLLRRVSAGPLVRQLARNATLAAAFARLGGSAALHPAARRYPVAAVIR